MNRLVEETKTAEFGRAKDRAGAQAPTDANSAIS
jgi:hypothetical protein